VDAPLDRPRVNGCVETLEEHFDFVRRALRRQGVAACDVDDLMQNVFIAMWRGWSDYDPRRPVRPWLWGIAFRVARNHLRRRWREVTGSGVELEIEDAGPPGDERLASAQARALVLRLLAQLPEMYRTPLVLYELDGITAPEVAALLAVPLPTVYTRVRRARLAFARLVEEQGHGHRAGAIPPMLLGFERMAPPAPAEARRRVMDRVRALALEPPVPGALAAWWRVVAVGALVAAAGALVAPRWIQRTGKTPTSLPSADRASAPVARDRSEPAAPGPRAPGAAPAAGDPSLIGYWSFDEPALWIVDRSNNRRDCLLNKRDPAQAFTEEGRVGGALDLAGQGWLVCAQPVVSTEAPSAMTVAAWVKLHSFPQVHAALVTRQLHRDHRDHFFLGFAGDQLRVGSYLWQQTVLQPAPLALERWLHVAFTEDRDGQLRLFLDGAIVVTRHMPHIDGGTVTSNVTIGAGQFSRNARQVRQKLDGVVDEVRIYDRALSPAEIATLARPAQ
jgi:RNA polymerase sigma-70 factor (ECF subfamily)